MLGSTPSELLPTGDSGTPGSAPAPGALHPDAVRHEPAAVPPLLRDRGAALVEADHVPSDAPAADVATVIDQLSPIRSHASLASSFAREANPGDPVIRTAYGCVWADLAMSVALGTTRRARIRATMAEARRPPVRGPG